MRKIFSIGIMVMMVLMTFALIGGNVSAAVTVYANDRPGWESAVGFYYEEFFTDATLNPGVSVVSDNGYVHPAGYWWDRVDDGDWGDPGTTTWSFDFPITAWGGTFDTAGPGGPGSSIVVELVDGTPVYAGTIPNSISGTFWGFVSDTPFVKVHLKDAELIDEACETYTMDNMVYSAFLDQQQTKDRYHAGCYDRYWNGQSFKPTLSTLTGVKLYMMKLGAPPSNVVLSVRSSLHGPDLTSLSKPASEIPTSWDWVVFDFPDISVTPGNTYYLVLRTTGGTMWNSYIWSYGLVTPYTSGELWKSYAGGSPGSWLKYTWYDFCFKTYGY